MPTVDDETKRLQDSIFIGKILHARQRSFEQKFLDGFELFDIGCLVMKSGIRSQFPEFTEAQVELELRRRLAIGRRIAEAGMYRDVENLDE